MNHEDKMETIRDHHFTRTDNPASPRKRKKAAVVVSEQITAILLTQNQTLSIQLGKQIFKIHFSSVLYIILKIKSLELV